MKAGSGYAGIVVRHGLLVAALVAYAGCFFDVGDPVDTEEIGTAQQAVVGARCGAGYPLCAQDEKCCWAFLNRSYCRDILWDEDNCGDCGVECDSTDLCIEGECQYFGK